MSNLDPDICKTVLITVPGLCRPLLPDDLPGENLDLDDRQDPRRLRPEAQGRGKSGRARRNVQAVQELIR